MKGRGKSPAHLGKAERFKEGQKTSGAGATRHAGPTRVGETRPKMGTGREGQE
jgi:hypothetical protein